VHDGAARSLVEGERDEASGIEPVHGRPAIGAVTDVGGCPALPRRTRDQRDEAVVTARGVHSRREPQRHRVDATVGVLHRERLRSPTMGYLDS